MLNAEQIAGILEVLEVPACVYDPSGEVAVQNDLGSDIVPHTRWNEGERAPLGDGWTLVVLRRAAPESLEATRIEDIATLANGMAHSIRNPLSSIVTAANLVQDDPNLGEETAMLLGIIIKESKHLNQILTDFLNYVRPRPREPLRLNLVEAMRHATCGARREMLADTVEISDDLPEELWIEGDEAQLQQVLWNVLRNAAEAMPEGGTLKLRGRVEDGKVILEIEDSGRGFTTKELARAFDPFYSNTSEGTGLGLTLARSHVAAMGGSIHAENIGDAENIGNEAQSERKSGARVRIELPHSPHESPSPEAV